MTAKSTTPILQKETHHRKDAKVVEALAAASARLLIRSFVTNAAKRG